MDWWAGLDTFEKVLWCIAVPFTMLTFVQVLMELLGAGDHGGDMTPDTSGFDGGFDAGGADGSVTHADVAGHPGFSPVNAFSVKGFIIFFCAFGWIGLGCYSTGLSRIPSAFIGALVGVVCMFLFAWIFYTLNKFTETGNYRIQNALGKSGKVYIPIPGKMSGAGKVLVVFQGASRDLSARTDDEDLPRGTPVKIVKVVDDSTVIVAKE